MPGFESQWSCGFSFCFFPFDLLDLMNGDPALPTHTAYELDTSRKSPLKLAFQLSTNRTGFRPRTGHRVRERPIRSCCRFERPFIYPGVGRVNHFRRDPNSTPLGNPRLNWRFYSVVSTQRISAPYKSPCSRTAHKILLPLRAAVHQPRSWSGESFPARS